MKNSMPARMLGAGAAGLIALVVSASSSHAQSAPPIWTGMYVGGSAGYQTGEYTLQGATGSADLKGFSGGGYVGYAMQSGSFVYGLEASYNAQAVDFSETTNDGITTDTVTLNADQVVMLRGRAGMTVGPALLYATAGVGWSESTFNFVSVDNGGAGTLAVTFSDWSFGYVVGGGVEVPISKSLKLRGEAIYQSYDVEFDATALGGTTASFDYDTTLIQAGLTYTFN